MSKPVMLITGGSRGIGAACAVMAAQRGYTVAFTYRSNQAAAQQVLADINNAGAQGLAISADVANEADILRSFQQIDHELGPLSVLVNNAGILETQKRLEDFDLARLQRVFATNVFGSLLCAREAVRRMSNRHGGKGGAIINLSSAAARLGAPNEYIDYAASKGAIDSFTVGLAKEVAAEGIRVNAVRPGVIATEIHASGGEPGRVERVRESIPLQRGGSAQEVAEAILWLASEQASYVTGSILDVTGGR